MKADKYFTDMMFAIFSMCMIYLVGGGVVWAILVPSLYLLLLWKGVPYVNNYCREERIREEEIIRCKYIINEKSKEIEKIKKDIKNYEISYQDPSSFLYNDYICEKQIRLNNIELNKATAQYNYYSNKLNELINK